MDKKKITGLWVYKDKNGGEYMTGKVSKKYLEEALAAMKDMEEPQILIYPYTLGKNGKNKSPDLIMYVAEGKKQKQGSNLSRFKHGKNIEKPDRYPSYSKDFMYKDNAVDNTRTAVNNAFEEDGEFPY